MNTSNLQFSFHSQFVGSFFVVFAVVESKHLRNIVSQSGILRKSSEVWYDVEWFGDQTKTGLFCVVPFISEKKSRCCLGCCINDDDFVGYEHFVFTTAIDKA